MIIVTGGAGFIGSNIINALNHSGYKEILVVDNLKNGNKFVNLVDLDIADYMDKKDFIARVVAGNSLGKIDVVFHQGACSATTEWDGHYMMDNNYQYSKEILHFCLDRKIPLLYASSAAVYGGGSQHFISQHFIEEPQYEKPLNIYGYSKFLFDQYVRARLPQANSAVCGLRYFNVYGPRESHKDSMASVAFHLNNQINCGERPRLFAGSENFRRDFIYVDDVAAINIWCWQNSLSGIFNCGPGQAESFQAVADAVVAYRHAMPVEYVPFPEKLRDRYQEYTQADLTKLHAAGYDKPCITVAEGVKKYLSWLAARSES